MVLLRSKRQKRAAAVQKLQHLLPAVFLLGDGGSALASGRAAGVELAIALLEVVSGALFLVATARNIRDAARGQAVPTHDVSHHGVDWTDVFAAAVVFAETVEHYHRTGHIVRPNVLMIATLLALAFFHGRLLGFAQRRRAIRVSDEGLSVGGRPFRRGLRAPWASIRSIDVSDRFASIVLKNGRTKRIDLGDLENDGPVRAALRTAQGRLAEMTLT